ncbi:uncharacterized protein LOC112512017 isoform X1 [Cynara cardunculus var. scolymus]|uniref:uncharacterized protein LOC112512017 isoform X1 n=1 Tax=Cynara cardunculus var. scolymus TaxID=59895 RepID=UPI000D625A73|nr:uncharacterized protein LOC112512017 isoform X1 [Cynara cardunculus var. scolymus]
MSDGTHDHHRVLRIYRLAHMNVVPLNIINEHLDCSGIQPYRCNERFVLALHPLPHCGTGRYKQYNSCRFCSRKLRHPNEYQFCSIACKINDEKPTAKESTIKPPAPEDDAGAGTGHSDKRSSPRKRSRKGVPMRALLLKDQA